ncbi:MAG: heme A synthase, partial [Gemmatimonadota bacterium]
VAGVVLQGLLGGLTVRLRLPDLVSVSHAALAQIVFGLTVAIALVCSRGWTQAGAPRLDRGVPALSTLASLVAVTIYGQILLGAIVRHTGAGLAIPDFPLAYGQLVPPLASRPVALHFAHRVGAVFVVLLAWGTAWRCWRHYGDQPGLARAGTMLAVLVALQVALGGATVLTYKAAWVATLHLGAGALCLAASVVLALRSRHLLRLAPSPASAPLHPVVVEATR